VGYFDANETTPPALFSIFLKISGSKDKQFIEGFGLYITRIGSPSGHPIHLTVINARLTTCNLLSVFLLNT